MNELVGVGLQAVVPLILALGGPAEGAALVFPAMLGVLEADVALNGIEVGHGVASVGVLAAIEAAAGQEAGDLRHGDTVDLLMEDVVQPLLQVRDLVLQTHDQALGDLP